MYKKVLLLVVFPFFSNLSEINNSNRMKQTRRVLKVRDRKGHGTNVGNACSYRLLLSLCYSILSTNYPVSAIKAEVVGRVLFGCGGDLRLDRLFQEESEIIEKCRRHVINEQ